MLNFTDVTGPDTVEIKIKWDGKVIWVNVDGICRFRACRVRQIVLIDERDELKKVATQDQY